MPKIWTENEKQTLIDAKNKNPRIKNIKVPGRSKKSVHLQLIKLGLVKLKFTTKKHTKKRWTKEEIKILHESKNKHNISLPGRTRNSILSKLIDLGIIDRQKPKKPWLKKENKILIKLVKSGKSAKEIFLMNILPYSKNSIQKKICFLGLTKKKTNAKYFSKEIRESLKKFLQDNWQGKTPEDLLTMWNEKKSIKVNKTKIIYYLSKMNIKIPYGEVVRIKKLRKKELDLRNNISLPKDLLESLRLSRANVMRKRILQNRDIFTGLPLSEIELKEIENDKHIIGF